MFMKTHYWLALALVGVTALLYAGVRDHEYLSWDDDVFVYRNPHLQPPSWQSVEAYWSAPYAHLYVPVPYTVWVGLARALGGPGPRGDWQVPPGPLHLASAAFHALNVLLVFGLLRLLTGEDRGAAAGALLFAVHPMQVESVAWSSELKDLLSGAFSLASLWLYLVWCGESQPGGQRRRWMLYGAATLAFVLALLSKPNAVALPLVAGLLAVVLLHRTPRRAATSLVPWVAMALAYAVFTRHVQPVAAGLDIPLWQRPFVAGDALAFYMAKALLPLQLAADYGRTPQSVLQGPWVYVVWLVPAAVVTAAVVARRRWPWVLAGVGVLCLALLPALGLTPFDFQQYSTVADHYAYVAMLGPALLVAGFLSRPRRFLAYGLCGIAFVLLALQSSLQVLYWNDNLSFWQHTLEVNRRSWLAHNNLGATYQTASRPTEAIWHYQQGLRLKPDDAAILINLGLSLYTAHRDQEALPYLERGLWLRPGDPKAHYLAGVILLRAHRAPEALPHFAAVLDGQPDDANARLGLAKSLQGLGRRNEAVAQLRTIVDAHPDFAAAVRELRALQAR
jgi:protein O-mannosyl-transferase